MKHCLILSLILTLSCCTPTKRIAKTEVASKSEALQVDSTTQITRQRLDMVMMSVAELRETMAEWRNENIDYTEQRYDSLGRLISTINQKTSRNSGKEIAKTDNVNTYVGLTIEQIDSLFAVRFSSLKSDLKTKEAVAEKRGFAWWQELLMWLGALAWIIATYFCGRYIKRFFWK